MVNINHLIISGVLAIVLANYVFPRMIYLMCEMILFLVSWRMMLVVFESKLLYMI